MEFVCLFQHLCSPPATESNKGTSHSDIQSVLARATQVLYSDNCCTPAVMAGYNSCPIDPSLMGSHRPPAWVNDPCWLAWHDQPIDPERAVWAPGLGELGAKALCCSKPALRLAPTQVPGSLCPPLPVAVHGKRTGLSAGRFFKKKDSVEGKKTDNRKEEAESGDSKEVGHF